MSGPLAKHELSIFHKETNEMCFEKTLGPYGLNSQSRATG